MNAPKTLPRVDKVTGAYFNPQKNEVNLDFQSDGEIYAIPFTAQEIFQVEEWFIKIRQSIGIHMKKINVQE
ncbi:hypothetical protein [Nisaea sp.]|uniref:hypothetical protein n=1 Tax=Nisaea sp. TaxID=2024842 RepID=UPI0032635924